MILCIETATTNCSVALSREGELLALKEDYSSQYSHAERLHIYIETLLKENDLTPGDLTAVAVSKGPGSYTGLRIGVSAAKGLCFGLGIPLISVPTLESLARQVDGQDWDSVIPLLDARRMEVYTAGYNKDMEPLFDTKAHILQEDSFGEYLEKGKVVFIGNGAGKFQEICTHPNALFLSDRLPSAGEMTQKAFEKFKVQDFESVAYFEPYYLKDFVAG